MTSLSESALRHMTDEQLARESVAGCSRSFAVLVERYEGRLLRFVGRWASSEHDAEDITQDAFVEAWRCLHRYDDRWRFSTWLYTIASRRAASHFRRRKDATSALVETHEDVGSVQPSCAMEASEQRSRMWQLAEALLSNEQRTALFLKYAEEMSASEIGQVLGKRPGAVRVILFRARERLAAELDLEEGESVREEREKQAADSLKLSGSGERRHELTIDRPSGRATRTLTG